MRYLLLLLVFGGSQLHAQINLIIEDETGQGFFLSVNGYVQNPEKKKKLIIKELDTVPYLLSIDSDTFRFTKNIHLRERTGHHYVLTKDYHGDLKLRYRGTESRFQEGYTTLSFNRSLPATVALAESPSHPEKPKNKKPTPEKANEPAAKETQQVEVKPADPPTETNDVLLPGNDTLEEEGRTVVLEKPIPTATPYEMLQEKLAATLYEFERLMYSVEFAKTHSISTEQVAEIFGQLKYDNTRIQFLKDVRKKIKDPENLNQLKEEVEYEITKQQLQKMIDAK